MRAGHVGPALPIAPRLLWIVPLVLLLPSVSEQTPTELPAIETARAVAIPSLEGERRVALVIGNGGYRHVSPLDNPPNDARLMSDTLSSLGFRLVGGKPLLNADRPEMERAIRAFGRELNGGAVAFFFYAGHGVQVEGENFLVPVTADVASAADIKYELIDVGYVLDEMRNAGNRLNIVVLDACRNNPFGARGVRAMTRGLALMQAPAGTIISYATQPGSTAADGSGRHSPFTTALTKALNSPGLGVFETFNQVGLLVKAATAGEQEPWFNSSPIEGSFVFRPPPTPPPVVRPAPPPPSVVPPAPVPPPVVAPAAPVQDEERAFWDSIKDSDSSAQYWVYLNRFPDGRHAGEAITRINRLQPNATAKTGPIPGHEPEAPVITPSADNWQARHLHSWGISMFQRPDTEVLHVGTRQYDPLPESARVVVYSAPSQVKRSYEVVAKLSHSNPCQLHVHRCDVKDAIAPLSVKAREVGANAIIIDRQETVKTSPLTTGVEVEARAIRLAEK